MVRCETPTQTFDQGHSFNLSPPPPPLVKKRLIGQGNVPTMYGVTSCPGSFAVSAERCKKVKKSLEHDSILVDNLTEIVPTTSKRLKVRPSFLGTSGSEEQTQDIKCILMALPPPPIFATPYLESTKPESLAGEPVQIPQSKLEQNYVVAKSA